MSRNRLFRLLHHYPVSLLCAAVIWIGCLVPLPPHTLPPFSWSDKAVHALMYLVLCGCIWTEHWRAHSSLPSGRKITNGLWLWAVLTPIIMSGLIELAQEYITENRRGDWADFAANSLGCLIAAAIGFTLRTRLKKPKMD